MTRAIPRAATQVSKRARQIHGARCNSMKWMRTKRILTMAISITATPVSSPLNPARNTLHDRSAHDKQVAENSNPQIGVALLLNSQPTLYLTKYNSGNNMIQSRSTMCQKMAPLSKIRASWGAAVCVR